MIMSLTLFHGPLSGRPAEANYRIEGPAHRLFFDDFPRRVRAKYAGQTLLDTRRGKLLHETGLLPQLYVPRQDARFDMLEATDRKTHCPFKGDACYWSVRVGERAVQNAVWAYPQPSEAAAWLRDYIAVYWATMDAWFDEDEAVEGHLRDPYHRVDVRETSHHLRVCVQADVVAETKRPKILSETGLANRYYVPPADIRADLFEPSATQTVCPYKGVASYRALRIGDQRIEDVAWLYAEPLPDAGKIGGYLCFDLAEGLTIEIDGAPVPGRKDK
ncbi:hypothetical protein NB231_00635 [Nitrococcus mobilis Nb-231]|uniref:DUF427 domain-containing protein n=2 Tax=Nitrococcus mobilis TaxID=35797 RepID=A4BST8_9GAMM|nr:hypothetical protein NB231_00635 [Nitrococcus mobilis Nb-231]